MTYVTPSGPSAAGSNAEQLLHLWMLPVQFSLDLMQTTATMMLGTLPHGHRDVHRSPEELQEVARAAEEQAAEIDDEPNDTLLTPAALVS